MWKEYNVLEDDTITEFLIKNNYSKKDVKKFLVYDKVYVGNTKLKKYNHKVCKGSIVRINLSKTDLNIMYEDEYLIIVDKPYNLLCISTEKNNNSLYRKVSEYVKISNKNNKIFIVNRLDKETSGLVVFAKKQNIKLKMQSYWEKVIRKYITIVSGQTEDRGIIKSYLKEEKSLYVHSAKSGKLAITEYKKLSERSGETKLEINLKTGRKNQIRVHLKELGCIIKGDVKYGGNKERRMYLHAYYLEFIHPVTNKKVIIKTIYPF